MLINALTLSTNNEQYIFCYSFYELVFVNFKYKYNCSFYAHASPGPLTNISKLWIIIMY